MHTHNYSHESKKICHGIKLHAGDLELVSGIGVNRPKEL